MKILIVEDDPSVAAMIKESLEADSHSVEIVDNGSDGSFLGRSYDYDAIILDYSLPKKNGLAVCREIRAGGKMTPIVFLSVTGDADTKVAALEGGADDYMTKPFSLSELRARLQNVVRRPKSAVQSELQVHDLVLRLDKQVAERGGKLIHLTRKEFNLLEYFMRHAGTIVSRALLMEHVWTAESDPFSNTVEAHMRNLRKKINFGNKPNLIINMPGRGYMIDTPKNLSKI